MTEDWLLTLLKEMVKNQYTMADLGKMKIFRDKSDLTSFHFDISINKSVFEDILSDEEKGLIWLEGGSDVQSNNQNEI